MTSVTFDPPIPTQPIAETLAGFSQTIRLVDDKTILASARWHCPSTGEGVVQILELAVAENLRRKGNGSTLLRELIQQAIAYHKSKTLRIRRVWIVVEQKSQVIARAFLTKHGFHHTGTINELLRKQDALVYVKAMD